MKIIFIGPEISIHIQKWVDAFKNDNEVYLITMHPVNDNSWSFNNTIVLKFKNAFGYYLNALDVHRIVKDIKPDVDVAKVVANLSDKDYDVQATQMEEIARISMENPQNAVPFVVKEIFMSLIDVVQKDTSNLTPPSPEQINARKKIIVNELIKEQAKTNGEDLDKIELPYTLTDAEKKSAATLTDMEQAERNKEYALYTMAALAKVYTDEVFKHTGNVVPMTDLPGVSTVVDTLRYNQNSGVKIAAIDALRYIRRPEYKDELISLFSLAARDENPYVAKNAIIALASMEDMK